MKPEEIQIIVESLSKVIQQPETSYSPIYVLLSVVITLITSAIPLIRYVKKMFTKSIEKVVISHNESIKKIVDDHFVNVKNVFNHHRKYIGELFKIMDLHIKELKGIDRELEDQDRRIEQIERKLED
jgi:hypothetical protein